ncbi:hypothetical protein E0J20_09090 [Rhizobium leguminosarum bv. viciae]|nr:hypothetical protein E0J20_09090 [Rhizobium leguminosarum bv. viciae]
MTPAHVASLKIRFPSLWNDAISELPDSVFPSVEAHLEVLAIGAATGEPCAICGKSAAGLAKSMKEWAGPNHWLCAEHIIEAQLPFWKGQKP